MYHKRFFCTFKWHEIIFFMSKILEIYLVRVLFNCRNIYEINKGSKRRGTAKCLDLFTFSKSLILSSKNSTYAHKLILKIPEFYWIIDILKWLYLIWPVFRNLILYV